MTRLKNIDKSHSSNNIICIIVILRELALLFVKHIIVVKVFQSISVRMVKVF